MKKFSKAAMCLLAMVMTITAYAAESDLYGRWIQTETEGGVVAIVSYEFNADGTMNQMMVLQSSSPKMEITGDATCNYTYKGNTITFKFKPNDINITKCEIEGVDPSMVQMVIQQQKQQMSAQEQRLTDVKINGSVLTAKMGKEEITLNKVQ